MNILDPALVSAPLLLLLRNERRTQLRLRCEASETKLLGFLLETEWEVGWDRNSKCATENRPVAEIPVRNL